jgi:hypothetical protein
MSVYVPPHRPTPYGPIFTAVPEPEPEPEPMPDKPSVRSIPRDQTVMAAAAIDEYLVANPRLGLPDGLMPAYDPDTTSLALALDAVCAYLLGEWVGFVVDAGPLPGDAVGWQQRREAGLHHTFATIERERGGQSGPPPAGSPAGPLSVAGRNFEVPSL